jgi:hypothetical protein
MTTTTRPTPTVGVPAEQVRQWADWVRADLAEITARVDDMVAEQTRLLEQSRLLDELMSAAGDAPGAADGVPPDA